MKFIKYYFLKLKFNIFKHLSTSKSFDLKDASCMFSKKYQNKWYAKYAFPLSYLSLILSAVALAGVSALIHFFNSPSWLHIPIDIVAILMTVIVLLFCVYITIFGISSGILKEYLEWQINKKYDSDINVYIKKVDNELIELEKFNIIKEKEQLEEALKPIVQETKQIKKMKI